MALLALLLAGGLVLGGLWLNGRLLPRWVAWHELDEACDLDGDGTQERVILDGRRLTVARDAAAPPLYQTDPTWFVSDAFVQDVDGDGSREVVCLLWKRGSFGPSRPFWVKRDDPGFSQHIFVWTMRGGRLRALWQSSALPLQVRRMAFDQEARLHVETPQGEKSAWAWYSWGFVEAG